MMNRRRFLLCSSATPIALAYAPKSHAWVLTALSIASSVAGMIASRHQQDMGTIYSAYNSQKLSLLINQVAEVQALLGDVISRIISLEKSIADKIISQSVRELHRELLGAISRYHSAKSLSEAPRLQALISIREDLERSLFELKNSSAPFDSGAALVVPSSIFTLNALNLTIYPNEREFRSNQLIRMYNWVLSMTDERQSGSVAYALEDLIFKYENYQKKASEHSLFSRLSKTKPVTGHCYGINEYKRWKTYSERCHGDDPGPTCYTVHSGYDSKTGRAFRWFDELSLVEKSPDLSARLKELGLPGVKLDEDVPVPRELELKRVNQEYDFDAKNPKDFEPSLYIGDEQCKKNGIIEKKNVFKDKDGSKNLSIKDKHKSKLKHDGNLDEANDFTANINQFRYDIYFHYNCLKNCNITLDRIRTLLEAI